MRGVHFMEQITITAKVQIVVSDADKVVLNNNPHVKRAVFTLPYKGVYHTTTLKGHQKRLTTAIFTLAYPLKGSLYSLVDRLSSIISSFS